VGDAGDRLAERRQLLGLQQLVIEIARLIFETLALADVAHQRFDAEAALGLALCVRRDFDPDCHAIGAAQAHQVIGDRTVALQALYESFARLKIDEPLWFERTDFVLRRIGREAKHQLEVGIG
jgi:hypothetical protein